MIDADGWMHTGDLAEMDPSGYVRIAEPDQDLVVRAARTSRRGDRGTPHTPIIVDGRHQGALSGERLMAVVKLKQRAELTIERLREYCMGTSRDSRSRGACGSSTSSR